MATRKELLYEDALNNIWEIGMDYDGVRTVAAPRLKIPSSQLKHRQKS